MLKYLLAPLALLYRTGVFIRHVLFDWGVLKSERFDIPIICIGNITVGGTGKTPMAETVIAYMSEKHAVALLSRGYGRRTKGYIEVLTSSRYLDVGDEPLQIKRKFPKTLVVVCEKRAVAIRRIREEHPEVDLIVLDDAFQHRQVEPTVNVIMVDYTRPTWHDKMLPVGALRDLPGELYRAHYFVVTKCPENITPLERSMCRKELVSVAYQRVYFTHFENFLPQAIFADEAPANVERGQAVIALSGIGNPKPFLRDLHANYTVVEEITYNDHHVYMVSEMRRLEALLAQHPGAVILTTEKDAVKLTNREHIPEAVRRNLYYIPINISFIKDSATDLMQRLEKDVRGN